VYDKLLKPRQSFRITLYISTNSKHANRWRRVVILLPRPFYSQKKALGTYFIRRLRGFREQSVRYGLENNLFFLADIETRLLGHPARSLVSTLATLFHLACLFFFFLRFIAKKVCTTCSKTNNRIVPLSNFNKHLYNGKREIKVNVHKKVERERKNNTATSGELMRAECASVVYVCVSCT